MELYSISFLSCFLPAAVFLHSICRSLRIRNALLLAAGLIFYACGSLTGLLTLLLLSLAAYLFGLLAARARRKGPVVAAAAVLCLGVLVVFKYLDFLLSAVWAPAGGQWSGLGLAAPAGLSFFTFKCLSYVIDAAKNPQQASRRFTPVLLYTSFFPQLMAGPITRFADFSPALAQRETDLAQTGRGLRRFVIGLAKKVLLAEAMGRMADAGFGLDASQLSPTLAWLSAVCYTLQIYLDFSGYSDMAIGLGRMFGFETGENFLYPYTARSITDFWRRWHISLSLWFRDYLYIPLGGSRRGRLRTAANKLIVFVLCGLWHGAGWTFLAWGLWHGMLSALESLLPRTEAPQAPLRRALGHVLTMLAVCAGFVLFRADTPGDAIAMLGAMIGGCGSPASAGVLLRSTCSGYHMAMLAISAAACLPLLPALKRHCAEKPGWQLLSYLGCAMLLLLSLAAIAAGDFSPFIYYQF